MLVYIQYRELLKPNGVLLKEGDTLKMPKLSAMLEKVADEGSQYFYNSSFTEQMVDELQRDYGAILTVKDFNDYSLEIRESLLSEYEDLQLIGVPPPASGAVNALVLSILEGKQQSISTTLYWIVLSILYGAVSKIPTHTNSFGVTEYIYICTFLY